MLTNAERAAQIEECLALYRQRTQSEREDCLNYFLASAMHWADEQGQNFDETLMSARLNYQAEVEEERQQRASLRNFTIGYTDLSGDGHTYGLEALDHLQAERKFIEQFPDGFNRIEYVIAHETSPGYKQLHERISELVESGKLEDAEIANLLAELVNIP